MRDWVQVFVSFWQLYRWIFYICDNIMPNKQAIKRNIDYTAVI